MIKRIVSSLSRSFDEHRLLSHSPIKRLFSSLDLLTEKKKDQESIYNVTTNIKASHNEHVGMFRSLYTGFLIYLLHYSLVRCASYQNTTC